MSGVLFIRNKTLFLTKSIFNVYNNAVTIVIDIIIGAKHYDKENLSTKKESQK